MFARIRQKIRNVLQDNSRSTFETFTATDSLSFDIAQENVIQVTSVTVNGTAILDYSYANQKVDIESGGCSANDVVIVYYSYHRWSDTELDGYILSALYTLDCYSYPKSFVAESGNDEIYPIPTKPEQNLIATIASILINPNMSSYRTSSVSISYPNKISKEEKIEKLIARFKMDKLGIGDIIEEEGEDF
jgi:hypothetical protein